MLTHVWCLHERLQSPPCDCYEYIFKCHEHRHPNRCCHSGSACWFLSFQTCMIFFETFWNMSFRPLKESHWCPVLFWILRAFKLWGENSWNMLYKYSTEMFLRKKYEVIQVEVKIFGWLVEKKIQNGWKAEEKLLFLSLKIKWVQSFFYLNVASNASHFCLFQLILQTSNCYHINW